LWIVNCDIVHNCSLDLKEAEYTKLKSIGPFARMIPPPNSELASRRVDLTDNLRPAKRIVEHYSLTTVDIVEVRL